jgi:hypothetical protein
MNKPELRKKNPEYAEKFTSHPGKFCRGELVNKVCFWGDFAPKRAQLGKNCLATGKNCLAKSLNMMIFP